MNPFIPRVRFPSAWRGLARFQRWAEGCGQPGPGRLRLASPAALVAGCGWLGGEQDRAASGLQAWSFGNADEGGAGSEADTGDRAYHIPVLEEEVVQALAPSPGKLIMDGTLGGGGHTRRLLEHGANVLALDQDPDAIAWATEQLEGMADRMVALRANFASFPAILEEAGVGPVLDGILLDLGVSSHQLDAAERGFSFLRDGPLDMRMDPDAPVCAADLVNHWTEEELARIFYEYGGEKASRRAAKAIVKRRAERPFETTADLAAVVATVIPKRGPASPATRVFQGLRIAVNDEMGALEAALAPAHLWLKPGGRLAVITFHSLEDRIVKQFFRRHSDAEIDRPEWPSARPNPDCHYRLITRKGITASPAETTRNPRARSATLRVVERLG